MKVLFNPDNGKIFVTVPDRNWFMFQHSIQIAYETFEIDEVVPGNQTACYELYNGYGESRMDATGNPKYFMFDNAGEWELHEVEDWVEEPEVG